ncbi:trk system potassium uptake protein TrkA [Andreprevotia lacus DSM 23236]|jgi:trk system potassium uptake protein TrkA|uniref:Trk system potassium uptake protein TrkA n=1 Tax=Andreprevotia lacus DSM 23236 TaxID=1121001 RepID=A0A1W1XXR2_9NEIS|nr:Trk system potassium transporter TrkA [Andreprevotia lacus]SMC28716.1 trk system potassium uptake protein TrkA [Andreprevotia lacus DSM 23236]
MSNILILGAGRVGASVAEQLVHEQYRVTVVDENAASLKLLQDKLDLRTVQGNAGSPEVLSAAGAADADLLLAVTPTDELNMVACKVAQTLFNVPTRLARIRNPDLLARPELFADHAFAIDHVITPAQIVTEYLCRLVETPEALQVLDFAGGLAQLVVVRVEEDADMAGKPLRALRELLPKADCRVVGIYRRNRTIRPDGDTQVEAGDEVFVLTAQRDRRAVLALFHEAGRKLRRILIAGGGNVGFRLARALQGQYQVKLIENNPARAAWLAEHLADTLVLLGDGTDEGLLETEQIERTDLYLALTSDDEDNIMSGLLAKQMGARKVIAIINRSRYVGLLQGSRIDVALSPAQVTIGSLLAHVRRGDIEAVHNLRRGTAEAMEIVAHGSRGTSRVVGRKVAELRLPDGIHFAALVRGEEVIIVHHDTEIADGDHVIVFVDNKRRIREVEHLFAVKLGFF